MKLIKEITLASALLGLSLSQAQAQTGIPDGNSALLAGWDFNNIGTSTIGSTNARYSDVWGDVTGSPFSANAGTLFVNGTAGSDNWPTIARTGSGDVDRPIAGRLATAGFGSLSGAEGSLSATGTISAARNEFSLLVHSLDAANYFSDLSLSYFARDSGTGGSSVTIDWFYSINGGAAVSTGLTNTISGSAFTEYTVDFSSFSAMDGVANLSLIGLITEGNANATLQFDNLGIYAVSAIPEPSTYAAILGAVTIGVVMLRRRRSAVAA